MDDGITPDLDEVQQDDPPVPALDVDVVGPVQVHALPARTAIMHCVTVGTTATQLFGRDLRRARVLIWATADATTHYHLGTRADEVQAETSAEAVAAAIGANQAQTLELRHCEAMWAKSHTGTILVNYVLEQWAD